MSLGTTQTVIQIIALVIGGGFTLFWTILNFFVLRQRRKAAGDLEQVELNIKNIEFQLRRTVCVRVDISATSFRRPDGSGYCILSAVNLINTGNKITRINWNEGKPALFFRRASFQTDRTPSFNPEEEIGMTPRLALNPNHPILSLILRPGATEHLAFAAHVEHPGVYLLSFRAPLNPTDEERSVSQQAGAELPTAWTAHHYIMVPAASNEITI